MEMALAIFKSYQVSESHVHILAWGWVVFQIIQLSERSTIAHLLVFT
jgi:hypothetical protein